MGFSWSEVSRRYIKSDPIFHLPFQLRGVADNVKQGSSDVPVNSVTNKYALEEIEDSYDTAFVAYDHCINLGVCPEQARMVLPQSMYTTTVTTGTLLGWNHMY